MDTTTPRTTKPTTEFPTTPPATPPTTPPNSHDTPPNAHYAQSTPPPYPSSDDDLRSASQVLKDAIAGFSKALGQGLTDVGTNVKNEVMTELSDAAREAAREFNQATEEIATEFAAAAPPSTRAARSEQTRTELMDAAERVFAAKGYEAASVMDLAKEAGFTKGALYAHFSSKEELFLAVITRGNEMGVAMQDVDPEASPEDLNTPIIPSEDDLSSIMLSLEAYLYALRHPEARETMRPLAEASITSLAAQVAFWRSGEKREPTDQELTMAMGLASLNTLGGIMNPILGPDWKLPERAETLAETIIGSGE